MPEYYEAQVAREQVIRQQERESARSIIISTAPEADRQNFLDALGLLEA